MSTNVEQIKERLDIVDVISSYLKVEKAGINFRAKCPFHNEKTPSFFISPSRQSFYCFGCGEKGDIFSFVEKFEGVDFKEALKILANRAGIELKEFKGEGNKNENERLFDIVEQAAKFYENNLNENAAAQKYLKNRGLVASSIAKWRLGLAKDDWRNLHDFLLKKGFSKDEMLKAGLVKKVSGENKFYDTFRNRVMFPIFDSSSRVIAFSGRAMKEDEKTPKYLNSPETELFYKSETLYGLNAAKDAIRKLDYAVLVEGQMDLLMSHQAGVSNTVASSGTALTELHLKKIKKISNRIIIAYDADTAGQKAMSRAAELALGLGMEVKIATLPDGEDPDSLIKKDPAKWKEALKQSEHFIDFKIKQIFRETRKSDLLREVLNKILPLVSLLKSEIEKSQFVKKIASKMGVSEEAVWRDYQRAEQKKDPEEEDLRDKKEELIFEAEKFGLKIDIEKVNREISKRAKINDYKIRRLEIARKLDSKDISKKEREGLEKDYKENEQIINNLEKELEKQIFN